MTDPDDDALSWEGDDRLEAPRRPAPAVLEPDAGDRAAAGATGLVVLGVLGGVALLETAFWVRSVLQLSIAASLTPGGGTAPEVIAFAVNVTGRVLAVVAPLAWYLAVLRLVRTPSKRLALLLLGAVVLVPWPILLGAA